ncbi:hypothetical protein EIN_118690 [Entamoeba invadens IP1]|uniref:Uncharacterized protein n=1 Tax=Entamoeba invadens IP1 TaxID=370355 RepID=L7FPZ1_ENTIV|nr:hypothetical protein EIN_118690 [Entamoeba invadens IP1]ELP92265.1 hypothetical protein EIN_118690 [Entamoeba invadens IP1]|eukprot:XP_004259036.1 hypothetical protein EIN_118690 [Entamoeba invadens IP1]
MSKNVGKNKKSKSGGKTSKDEKVMNAKISPNEDDAFPFLKEQNGGVTIEINVKPNSRNSEIQGIEDGLLKIAIDAPPVDGKANSEVVDFIATSFSVKKSSVAVVKGQTSHHKTVRIENCTKSVITAKLK